MTATKDRFLRFELGDYSYLPLAASAKAYRHTYIGQVAATNTFRPLVAGDKFAGVSQDSADNSSGGAGAVDVPVKRSGRLLETVTGASATTAIGTAVYASADDALTLTVGTNSLMGKIGGYDIASSKSIVEFNAALV